MKFIKNLLWFLFICTIWVIGFVAVLTIIGLPIYYLDKYHCLERTELMQKQGHFGLWTGCMVKINGNYVPLDAYRVSKEEK